MKSAILLVVGDIQSLAKLLVAFLLGAAAADPRISMYRQSPNWIGPGQTLPEIGEVRAIKV